MNKCKRCNRELKSDSSISLGYGSMCAKILDIKVVKVHKIKKYKEENIMKWC
jgi:hypothetical protein